MSRSLVAALILLGTSVAVHAEPSLGLPLACTPGETCWVVNYVDHDAGAGIRDYHCGALGYDGHDGTDFAIRDLGAVVAVVAAAAGTVRGARDGVPDTGLRGEIAGRECGNGVVIAHADGWETQYCHMRHGSVAVQPGEQVSVGQRLGLVGLSGNTEFPHLHLTVRRGRQAIDPFLGGESVGACRISARSLWTPDARAALAYRPIAVYNVGFSGAAPDAEAIRRGERPLPSTSSKALILWTDIFGVDQGDRLRLRITGPDGKVLLDHARTIDRRQIRRFEFAGKRRTADAWPAGTYTGEIAVKRGDAPEVTRTETVELR
jgi:murein DD-endopeptidase MepM/ murein hydrolase activator NlpD